MLEQIKVKKWGGENAAELTRSPRNIVEDYTSGIKQVVVVSAMRSSEFNTTDKLIGLGRSLSKEIIDKDKVKEKLAIIEDFHLSMVDENYKSMEIEGFHLSLSEEKYKGDKKKLKKFIKERFSELLDSIKEYIKSTDKIIPSKENDYLINTATGNISILGFGEIISADIQSEILNYLCIEGLKSESVDLKNVNENIDLSGTQSEVFRNLSIEIANKVKTIIDNDTIPIIPGYIPGFEKGIENTIGRGYSDATASITAVGLSTTFDIILEIQKKVKGMLSADPRLLEDNPLKLIEKMDYITASEITGLRGPQAKLLHNQVLRKELQDAGITVHLFNPFENGKGTIISKEKDDNSSGVEFIGGRENVTFFSVSSGSMSGKGVLKEVFSIVKKYASVDIIGTSETEISFTLDGNLTKNKLDKMAEKIRKKLNIKEDGKQNSVRYEQHKALVFCVGQNLSNNLGSLGRAAGALSNALINIEMVSQGINERAMIFGIAGDKMKEAVNALHEEFINGYFA